MLKEGMAAVSQEEGKRRMDSDGEEMSRQAREAALLAKGLDDMAHGRLHSADSVISEMKRRYSSC